MSLPFNRLTFRLPVALDLAMTPGAFWLLHLTFHHYAYKQSLPSCTSLRDQQQRKIRRSAGLVNLPLNNRTEGRLHQWISVCQD